MQLTILGAAGGEVTGSAYLLETASARILLDFGMFQGSHATEAKNILPGELKPGVDAVLLTHAHLDHTGRLPLLAKLGYAGPIYATGATIELADLILRDSGRIQESDAERENRSRKRDGKPLVEPLYGMAEVDALKPLFREVQFEQPFTVAPGVTARYFEAGHMLGSASIELVVQEDGREKVVVFSGDLGPRAVPILRDAAQIDYADVVILESTYGARDHRPYVETEAELKAILKQAVAQHAKVLVPAFAVGRTQQILYHIAELTESGEIPLLPVAVDSPMAIEATRVYRRHPDLYDEAAAELLQPNLKLLEAQLYTPAETSQESRELNAWRGPCVIIASSGMCTGGRILHHLRHNLDEETTQVIIVGYQGEGTLGRQLVDGADTVIIFGDQIHVRAQVHTLNGLSGHAGQGDLLRWFATLADDKPRVLLTHGEDDQRRALAAQIEARYGLQAALPALGDCIRI